MRYIFYHTCNTVNNSLAIFSPKHNMPAFPLQFLVPVFSLKFLFFLIGLSPALWTLVTAWSQSKCHVHQTFIRASRIFKDRGGRFPCWQNCRVHRDRKNKWIRSVFEDYLLHDLYLHVTSDLSSCWNVRLCDWELKTACLLSHEWNARITDTFLICDITYFNTLHLCTHVTWHG